MPRQRCVEFACGFQPFIAPHHSNVSDQTWRTWKLGSRRLLQGRHALAQAVLATDGVRPDGAPPRGSGGSDSVDLRSQIGTDLGFTPPDGHSSSIRLEERFVKILGAKRWNFKTVELRNAGDFNPESSASPRSRVANIAVLQQFLVSFQGALHVTDIW